MSNHQQSARSHEDHMSSGHQHSPGMSSPKANCCSPQQPDTAPSACCEPKPQVKAKTASCCGGSVAAAAHGHSSKHEHLRGDAGHHHHSRASDSSSRQGPALKDPVCGMNVSEASPHKASHAGATFYFCSAGCRTKFQSNPQQYLNEQTVVGSHAAHGDASERAAAAEVPAGAIYTCPMHPEMRQVGPGTCPKCGMALEPQMPERRRGRQPGAS